MNGWKKKKDLFLSQFVFCREQGFECARSSQQCSPMVATHRAPQQVASSQFLLYQSGRQSKHHRHRVPAAATPSPLEVWISALQGFLGSFLVHFPQPQGWHGSSFLQLPPLLLLWVFFLPLLHNTMILKKFSVQITAMVFVLSGPLTDYNVPQAQESECLGSNPDSNL